MYKRTLILATLGLALAGCGGAAATAPTATSAPPAASQSSTLTAATVLQRDGYTDATYVESQATINNLFAQTAPYVFSAEGGYYAGQNDGENGEIVAIMSKKGVDIYGQSVLQADLNRAFNPSTVTLDPSGVYIIRMSTGQ